MFISSIGECESNQINGSFCETLKGINAIVPIGDVMPSDVHIGKGIPYRQDSRNLNKRSNITIILTQSATLPI